MAVSSFSPHGLEVVQDLEDITLLRRGSDSETVADCKRRALTLQEVTASDGKYTLEDVRWHIQVANLATSPRLGDVIKDGDGQRFTVLDVRLASIGTRWRCITRDLAVVYHLNDTVAILRATYEKGTAGAAEPTWHSYRSGVRARIQPMASDIAVEHEAKRKVTRVEIYVDSDFAIDQNCRVLAMNGTLYKVTGYRAAERIGELPVIEAEETPWPLA